MAVKTVSKAIAGMVASVVGAWTVALWGFEIPADALEWGTSILATAIAGGLGFVITYVSPANE